MTPATNCTRLAARPRVSAPITGTPPATAASNPKAAPWLWAKASSSPPWRARTALLAVTTDCPPCSARRTSSVARPSPPMSSTTTSMSGSCRASRSVVKAAPPKSTSGLGERLATRTKDSGRPARRASASALSRSKATTPPATVPRPATPILKGCKLPAALSERRTTGPRRPPAGPPACSRAASCPPPSPAPECRSRLDQGQARIGPPPGSGRCGRGRCCRASVP